MNLAIVLQVLAGLSAIALAALILFQPPRLRPLWQSVAAGKTPRTIFAVVAMLAGIGMLYSVAAPFFAFFAAGLIVLISLVLLVALLRRDGRKYWIVPVSILVHAILAAVFQPLGLRVLFLPKADQLPYVAAEARVLSEQDEGVGFENILAGPDGTVYLTANYEIDPGATKYYWRAHGAILARRPDGSERRIFTTPVGTTAQGLAMAPDGTIFMTSSGEIRGIWRISADGSGKILSRFPHEAWPNGLDLGPDGKLYSADSSLGLIWRIDAETGHAEHALVDQSLLPRNSISLAPGANGLRFRGHDMFVTVSDRAVVLEYRLGSDGRFSDSRVIATGIPGDDLAIGPDGSVFVTTHVFNTLVRVAPNGDRTVIGDVRDHMTGATAAAFGRRAEDSNILYVSTDGGTYTEGARSKGRLVAVSPYGQSK